MKLSQKLKQLQDEARESGELTDDAIEDGFTRCIENAEYYEELASDLNNKLQAGRDYLMQVEPSKITVEDALEAFGFGKNGLGE